MHFPTLIQDLAIILGVAAVVTFIFRRINQPVVLGYIVAGVIVGPHTHPFLSVSDVPNITTWAELGVIFLMFSLGLEFSFRRLAKVGVSAAGTGILQLVALVAMGYGVGRLLDWAPMDSIFLGCMIAISSTTIIIKALEELGLKSMRFAELVFGILIVEDLAAILMLVALTNIASTSEVGGVELLLSAGKLAVVVGAWIVVGTFLVPRLVKSVAKHGTNETLTVVSLGLCLMLVSVSAYFHYSVALGAFIMGSILAETRDVHRIESLVEPLRDIFGAVFFVSVGMLLNPTTILENWQAVAVISLLIIVGKAIFIWLGAVLTGQNQATAVYAGLSMAQIGEFSFIIATLGLNYKVIEPRVYPIIVAASLVTTFTTPYLIKISPAFTRFLERKMPKALLTALENYSAWFQHRSLSTPDNKSRFLPKIGRWVANGLMVIIFFEVMAKQVMPWSAHPAMPALTWLLAFALSSPFIWGMATAFRPEGEKSVFFAKGGDGSLIFSRLFTVLTLGILSIEFFDLKTAVTFTVVACVLLALLVRRQLEQHYKWFEGKFVAGLLPQKEDVPDDHKRYAPWDMHLVEVNVDAEFPLVGQTLIQAQLREKYGINVVVLKRGSRALIAPKASEQIFPGDILLCSATDLEIRRMLEDLQKSQAERSRDQEEDDLHEYKMARILVSPDAPAVGQSIRTANLHEKFDSMVVGMERDNKRFQNPQSTMEFQANDIIWLVGPDEQGRRIKEFFQGVRLETD